MPFVRAFEIGLLWAVLNAHVLAQVEVGLEQSRKALGEIIDLGSSQEAQSAQMIKKTFDQLAASSNGAIKPGIGQTLTNAIVMSRYVTVSESGPEIINLIKQSTKTDPTRRFALEEIKKHAAKGVPEAIHFLGFVHELGLYGQTKDVAKAADFYVAAAHKKYQPSNYNLGLMAAYGRNGGTSLQQSRHYLSKAFEIEKEMSGRVCGMATLISYRAGQNKEAVRFSEKCFSPLANLVRANQDNLTPIQKVNLLSESLVTGLNDALDLIPRQLQSNVAVDKSFLFCKYLLIKNGFVDQNKLSQGEQAKMCVLSTGMTLTAEEVDRYASYVDSFARSEITRIKNSRSNNKFHYGWSVPFLPFFQEDVNLFLPLLGAKKS